ncbi:hypothetical protein EC960939_2343, partial [Escherichia coli 96.0939]|jgi:hypothetical protein
MSLSS